MSAFYLLGVFIIWAALTGLILKLWRASRKKAGTKRILVNMAFAVVLLVWLTISFWHGGGRKYYYDAEVERLCAIDGGIKVYETEELPANKFNEWGQPNFYKPTRKERALGDEYLFKEDISKLKVGNPELFRFHYAVIRQADLKLLSEAVSYQRGGGDLPGPWQPSAFTCPDIKDVGPNSLLIKTFVREPK